MFSGAARAGLGFRPLVRHGSRLFDARIYFRNQKNISSSVLRNIGGLGNLGELVFSGKIPKGFGKFVPGGDEDGDVEKKKKKEEKNTTSEKNDNKEEQEPQGFSGFFSDSSSDDKKKKDSSKGDHKNDNEDPNPSVGSMITGALACFLLYSLFSNSTEQSMGKEINWQEFKTHLLGAGEVERIVVVNRQIAKVYVKRPGSKSTSSVISSSGSGNEDGYHSIDVDKYDNNTYTQQQQQHNNNNNNNNNNDGSYPKRIVPQHGQGGAQYHFTIGSIDSFERKLEIAQRELGIQSRDFVPVQYVNETSWATELTKLAPTLLIIGAWLFMMRGAGGGAGGGMNNIFKIGKSNAAVFGKGDKRVGVSFKDVAGCDEAKVEIMEFVEFLKDPKRFTKLGAKIPKGALLCGPPGTGKTLLAKATAGEASVPFFSISGSDFIEMFVGVGPSRVRDLFSQARKNAPCIVFIDEIDAVARARSKGGFSGGNDERENTLNQLLVEMDGFSTKEGVVVLAGTNRIDILDQAILRPGRFDRQIKVDLPDIKGRKEIFEVHLRNLNVAGDTHSVAQRMAALTPGFAGAQIANVCNEAAILAARKNKDQIDMECFEGATDRVIGGLEKKNSVMTKDELRTVAYHEAGHAITGWFLEHCDPLLKVTIIPRMSGALGFAQYLPKEMALHTEDQLLDRMAMALGGRAAEEVTFGKVTTGAQDDLDKVTKIAYSMVTIFGMNKEIGTMSFPDEEGALVPKTRYSNDTANLIDKEVKKIVQDSYERTKQLLQDKKSDLEAVAEYLLENETITQHDIAQLIGPRPYAMPQSYEEFITASGKETPTNNNTEEEEEEEEKEEEKKEKH